MKWMTRLIIAINCVVLPLVVPAQTPVLLRTFNSPTPAASDDFGWDGLNSVNWSNVTAGVQTVGTNETLIVNPIGGSRFYRLVKP